MSEYVADEYEGSRPVPGEPGYADDASAKKQPAQEVRQPLRQSPAGERRR